MPDPGFWIGEARRLMIIQYPGSSIEHLLKPVQHLGRRRKIFVRDIQTDSVFETESVSQSGTILYCQTPYLP